MKEQEWWWMIEGWDNQERRWRLIRYRPRIHRTRKKARMDAKWYKQKYSQGHFRPVKVGAI